MQQKQQVHAFSSLIIKILHHKQYFCFYLFLYEMKKYKYKETGIFIVASYTFIFKYILLLDKLKSIDFTSRDLNYHIFPRNSSNRNIVDLITKKKIN